MTVKTNLPCLQEIPNIDSLAQTFSFIEDLVLRKNIAVILQYLIFLIKLEENHSLPGAISYIVFKDMIIHTASITEALLCYGLTAGIKKGKTSLEKMKIKDDKYKDFKSVYKITDTDEAGAIIQMRRLLSPSEMQFNDLIPAARRSGLINTTLEGELTIIRKARNKIHLSSLTEVDNTYSKENANKIFETTKKLKKSIIEFLA